MKRLLGNLCAAALAVCCAATSTVQAQPLADRVPEDAIAYLGWAGSTTLGESYGASHLKSVVDESRVRDLFGKYFDEIEAKLVKNEPDAREPFRLMRTLYPPLWKYPTAMFIGTPDLREGRRPKFRVAMMTRTSSDAEATKLSGEINTLLAKAQKKPPVPILAFTRGDLLCFTVGYDTQEQALPATGKTLAARQSFAASLKQVAAKPALIWYFDFAGFANTVEKEYETRSAVAKQRTTAFLDASGLRGLRSYISTSGFDGKDWVRQTFTDAPAPRAGLLSAYVEGPVDASLMKSIPADATFFCTGRFDVARFVREAQSATGKTDPEALKYFNMGLGALQSAVGTNVLESILEPMGSDWAVYGSPRVATGGILGLVAVNKLDDAEKTRKSLRIASINLANWITLGINRLSGASSGLSIRAANTKIGDVDVCYFTTPILAPSWAIRDGRLYLGLYPQVVGAAARQAGRNGPSIVDNEKYQAVMKRLGAGAVHSSSFYDLPTAAGNGGMYTQLLVLLRYAGFADLWGTTLPEPLMPPMDVLMDHLAPAGTVSWSDATGFHTKSVVPFPGATALTEQGAVTVVGAGTAGFGASILLPSLNRARETANRVKSASNLRQIGTAMALYANENRGKYPGTFADAMITQDIMPEVFLSPRTQNEFPEEVLGNANAKIGYASENGDYVYLGKGLGNDAPAETILVYENPEGLEDGINILFGDGHVEFVEMDRAMQLIEEEKKARGIN